MWKSSHPHTELTIIWQFGMDSKLWYGDTMKNVKWSKEIQLCFQIETKIQNLTRGRKKIKTSLFLTIIK